MSSAISRNIDSLSVVIPAYNSENCLQALMGRLSPVLKGLAVPAEVILVNDGSEDRTWQVIEELGEQYPFVVGINLMGNFGQQNAQLCGIRAARGTVIATIDDDLQNPPEELPRLLACLEEGYDLVYGEPRVRKHSAFRNRAAALSKSIVSRVCGHDMARYASDFRVFWTYLRDDFPSVLGSRFSIDALLSWSACSFQSIPVEQNHRFAGNSNYSLLRLVRHFLNLLTGFSTRPLHLATLAGILISLLGMLALAPALVFVGDFQSTALAFWIVPAILLAIFGGLQMILVGVLGEYVARLYFAVLRRPDYLVRSAFQAVDNPALDRVRRTETLEL